MMKEITAILIEKTQINFPEQKLRWNMENFDKQFHVFDFLSNQFLDSLKEQQDAF